VNDLAEKLAVHRPELLRHCYRMLGSFADAEDVVQDVFVNVIKARESFAGHVPLLHWLMRMATNACLNALGRRKRRALPQLEREASTAIHTIDRLEASDWLTPAPESCLFNPEHTLEARESVALAFLALLQCLPPRQRAVLLLKDVVGFSSEEIATTLDTTVASVSSALHRARETISVAPKSPSDPPPNVLREYIRSWEERDIDALVHMLRNDVVLAMPPHATWFRGASVGSFFRGERLARGFWTHARRVIETRANGQLALAFFVREGAYRPHSIQLVEFAGSRVAQAIQFIGPDYLRGFDVRPD
jgi:RNA polymerase sigma-70 factor, ECF subfamily